MVQYEKLIRLNFGLLSLCGDSFWVYNFCGIGAPNNYMGQGRARVVRNAVDHQRARTALAAVAADLRARQSELVAQGVRQRFLWQYVDASCSSVDVQRDQSLDAAGRSGLGAGTPECRTACCGRNARGDNGLDKASARQVR